VEGWCPGSGTGVSCCVKPGCFPLGERLGVGSACTWQGECAVRYGGRLVREVVGDTNDVGLSKSLSWEDGVSVLRWWRFWRLISP